MYTFILVIVMLVMELLPFYKMINLIKISYSYQVLKECMSKFEPKY
jgi:hypothetical protein